MPPPGESCGHGSSPRHGCWQREHLLRGYFLLLAGAILGLKCK